MSDQKIIDTIAATLGQHRLEQGMRLGKGESVEWWECLECGWHSGEFAYRDDAVVPAKRRHQSDAILAALRANNIAVVELPEPDSDRRWGLAVDRVTAVADEVVMQCKGLVAVYDSPICARERAAALLAAADAAERAE